MKGQQMLKVCSILMIIGGGIVLLGAIFVSGLLSIIASAANGELQALAILAIVIAILGPALELAAGIVGVKAAGMPSVGKIKAALVLGLLVVLLSLFNNIYSFIVDGVDVSAVIGLLLGLVVPVLYLVGLIQFKNALVELLSGE